MSAEQTISANTGFCATCGVPFNAQQKVALNGGISGPLCSRCLHVFEQEDPGQVRTLIDVYENPVLVINEQRRIIAANLAAIQALDQDMDLIVGSLAGDSISCENARLPGGCGHTVNCRACVINNSVTTTLSGPVEVTGAPAHQTILREGKHKQQTFAISTQQIGERVLVQVV